MAARAEGRTLEHAQVREAVREALTWWRERAELVVVEGVGGFLCPLAEETTVADLAIDLDFPVVIVARRGLGTLNHTLLTVEAIRHRGLRVAGVVLNASTRDEVGLAERTNAEELSRRLDGIAILADCPHDAGGSLLNRCIHDVNWDEWAAASRNAMT